MNYIRITKNDIANGEGVRVTLWLSGCNHNCKCCHNPQTHNPSNGVLFDEEAENIVFQELNKSYISGITLSGGDPLHENNLLGVLILIDKIRLLFPKKNIWIYSGFTWEHCMTHNIKKDIISKCDVMVDGRYEDKLRDITLRWRGSSNQNVIDIQSSLKKGEKILYEV